MMAKTWEAKNPGEGRRGEVGLKFCSFLELRLTSELCVDISRFWETDQTVVTEGLNWHFGYLTNLETKLELDLTGMAFERLHYMR